MHHTRLIYISCLITCTLAFSPSAADFAKASAMDGSKWIQIDPRLRRPRQATDSNIDSIPDTNNEKDESCQKDDALPCMRSDTKFNKIKHDYTFVDGSTPTPTRFPDMGYLMYGYDAYKGNVLTFKGVDPGFRHPLFDYGEIDKYGLTLDGRHTQPIGTMALPAQACTVAMKKKVIQSVEDLQERQSSAYSEESSFGFDGEKAADIIPDEAAKHPIVAGAKKLLESVNLQTASGSNQEFRSARASANREDAWSIFAEAECNVYRAKLNQRRPPPILPEVKEWISKMLEMSIGKQLTQEILEFLNYYGTHFISEIHFGARYVYNFTMTARDQAEIDSEFESFSNYVDIELGIGGYSASRSVDKESSANSSSSISNFTKFVETSISTIGAPIPATNDDGPDAAEWSKNVQENPVPIKLSLISIEKLLKIGGFGDSDKVEMLRKEILLMLPKKVVTDVKRTEIHCRMEKKTGKELDDIQELFETAHIALEIEATDNVESGSKGIAGAAALAEITPLTDLLLTKFSDEDRKCLKDSKAILRLRAAKRVLKEKLGQTDIFDLNVLKKIDIESVFAKTEWDGWDKIGAFFTKDTEEAAFWDKYGRRIIESLAPYNIARDCYQKRVCCTQEVPKLVTKTAGQKGSYVDVLVKNGGIDDDSLYRLQGNTLDAINKEIAKLAEKTKDVNLEKLCPVCIDDDGKDPCDEKTKKKPTTTTTKSTTTTTTTTKPTTNGCTPSTEEIEIQSCAPRAETVCSTEDVISEEITYEKRCKEVVNKHCTGVLGHAGLNVKREAEAEADPQFLGGLPYAHGAAFAPAPVAYAVPQAVTKSPCTEVKTEHCVDVPIIVEKVTPVETCHVITKVDCTPAVHSIPKVTCEAGTTEDVHYVPAAVGY